MTALKYGWLAVGSGASSNAVVTGSETASSFMRACNFEAENEARIAALEKRPALAFEKDFLRWMLSDGAGAFLLEPQPRKGALALRIDWIDQRSYAHQHEPCMYAGAEKRADGTLAGWRDSGAPQDWLARSTLSWKQDVRQLEDGIRAATTQAFAAVLAKRALRAQDFDWFVPHFSSEFFRPVMDDLLPAALRIPQERWFTNLQEKGNTGSAAIFLMLEELLNEGHLRAGQRLLCYVPESARFTIALAGLTVVAG
jgi:3-oxoacyl-[acyl-carrier-protein] synthase-3